MKITQKMIRNYLYEADSVDCTNWGTEEYDLHRKAEGGFDKVVSSSGTYGCNGLVMRGRRTGIYYVTPSRCSALFLFSW